ncbi:MAG: DUF2142 domain-containing protein [Planctomycetia bacterium]|nr:DUF2142 domain-containing protein [Planctomycetia bacterium]
MQAKFPQYRHALLLVTLLGMLLLWLVGYLAPVQTIWEKNDATFLKRTVKQLEGIQIDAAGNYQTGTVSGWLEWTDDSLKGLQYLKLSLQASTVVQSDQWLLQFKTNNVDYYDPDYLRTRTLHPLVEYRGDFAEITWFLPEPATAFRVQVPSLTRFSLNQFAAAGIDPTQHARHYQLLVLKLVLLSLTLGSFICWLIGICSAGFTALNLNGLISTGILLVHGIVLIFLLPPFQGPDENRHWKAAMKLYRSDGQQGSILHSLPGILNAEKPRWRSEVPFQALRLKSLKDHALQPAENIDVGYVKHWGYPLVGLISTVFPTVTSVQEALCFYFLCRMVPLLLLVLLVYQSWQMGAGSWTLVTFCSLPLVLQQSTIISTDTVPILGTFAVMLLLIHLRSLSSTFSWITVWLICLLVIAAKPPIYALIVLLPLSELNWKRWLRWQFVVPALAVIMLIAAAGIWLLWRVVDSAGMELGKEARLQLQYLMTGEGIAQFIQAAMEYPGRFLNPSAWCGPLGWLDTNISPQHVSLLLTSLLIAVCFDLAAWFRQSGSWNEAAFYKLLTTVVSVIVMGLIVWWSLALVMYLTITPYQADSIVGMQVRYMFPVLMALILWPVHRFKTCLSPVSETQQQWRLPGYVLLFLALCRVIFLAGDLQLRYWG